MPYTNKSVAMVWLITVGLFVLTGSGAVARLWVLVLLLVALAAPALILRSRRAIGVTTPSPERSGIVSSTVDV
jgi:uncharacterized protein (DUF58 family)